MDDINFNFVSNNVKGLQSSKKRLKLFEYFRNKISPNGIVFLQETHSTKNNEIKWKDEFRGNLYFSHGRSNSCGVLTAFLGTKPITVKKKVGDKEGRILILETSIDDCEYILINFYNANTESEQLKTFIVLNDLLLNFNLNESKRIIFAGDFNLYLNRSLDAKGGSPLLKKRSVSELIKIKEKLDLCDIWRVRNPKKINYTFRQQHFSGLIQRRLDYVFISQNFQEMIKKTEIFAAISTDHSPVFCSVQKATNSARGPALWKFNNSLV